MGGSLPVCTGKALFLLVAAFAPPAFSAATADVLEEGSFVRAAEKEDVALLRERIRIRLQGPFSDFVDEFFYLTESGGNIFHALAETKTNQEEFAKTLEELVHLFSVGFEVILYPNLDALTLAGTEIPLTTNLTGTALFQAFRTGKRQKISSALEAVFKGSALSVLPYLYSRAGLVRLLPLQHGNFLLKPFDWRPSLILNLNDIDSIHSLKQMIAFPPPYLKKDYRGFSPQKAAANIKNLPVFDVLSVAPDTGYTKIKRAELGMAAAFIGGGFLGGLGGLFAYEGSFFSLPIGFMMGGTAAWLITGVTAAALPACYRAWTRKKIISEKAKEAKTALSQRLSDASGPSSL